jgi:hypothetical protein
MGESHSLSVGGSGTEGDGKVPALCEPAPSAVAIVAGRRNRDRGSGVDGEVGGDS